MAVNRITGITSGFDTDKMVKDLMKAEQTKYDNVQRDKIYTEWTQEGYRSTITTIRDFQDKHFDLVKSENNLRSRSTFAEFSSTVKVDGESKNYVSATGTSSIKSLNHTISSIDKIAKTDEWYSQESTVASIVTSEITSSLLDDAKADGVKFNLTLDGNTEEIFIDAADLIGVTSVDDLATEINNKVKSIYGNDFGDIVQSKAVGSGEGLVFDSVGNSVKVYKSGNSNTLLQWGIPDGATNLDYLDKSIAELYNLDASSLEDVTINGKEITGLQSTDTLEEFISKINKSNTGIELAYNNLSKRFTMTSIETGIVNNIDFSGSAGSATVLNKFGFDVTGTTGGDGSGGSAYRSSAENAVIVLDGETVTKSSNEFTIDGAKYTLKETYTGIDGPIEIELENDNSAIMDTIKNFVNDYNDLIAKLHALISERENREYKPLTDAEKDSLSEDQITKWESQAKKGIMHRETNLTMMLDNMRSALYDSVEGVDISLTQIGITTTEDYKDKGKLIIDEDELEEALKNNYEDVVGLFTNSSDKYYLDSPNSKERYSENGISDRFNDILNDAVRSSRDTEGKKGALLEKAGMVDDATEETNTLSKEIDDYDKRLKYLLDF